MNIARAFGLCLGLMLALAVSAAQHEYAYLYVNWKTSTTTTYNRLEQRLQVSQKAPASFWASSWTWANSSYGGYVGLQTDGSRADGSVGDTVIFSIWNATAANGNCLPFGGEGVGYSCRLPYSINTAHKYKFRVQKSTAVADPTGGQWWDAYIRNESTGTESKIGSLQAGSADTSFNLPQNFSEYFGPAMPSCGEVPVSVALWSKPTLKPVTGYFSVTPSLKSSERGHCTGGSAVATLVNFQSVVKVTLGGPL